MKRLLVYCTQLMPTGGIESHIREFCRNLGSEGVEIHLVVPNYRFSAAEDKDLRKHIHRLYACRAKNRHVQRAWLGLTLVRLRQTRFDAVYTNGQGNTIAWVAKLLRGLRWVHHHHTSADASDLATWPSSYRLSIAKSDLLIACSRRNAENIQAALDIRAETIPCFSRDLGYRDENQDPTESEETDTRNLTKLHFGYFGRLIKEKGIQLVCELSNSIELSDIEFHFWGKEDQFNQQYFSQYPNVRYHGSFQSEQELKSIVSFLDAFLLLSTHPEGLPISLLEAMSGGLPWIASDRGGIVDIACDAQSTVVLPSTPTYTDAMQAIRTLADALKSGVVRSHTIVEFYRQGYSPKAVADQWKNAFFAENIH